MTAVGGTEANKKVPAIACAHGAESQEQAIRPQSYLGLSAIIASQPMQNLIHLVIKVAQTNATVLITGESGSGKELVARAVHHYSLRCTKPWVDLNCGALPEHLIESELFGYEKGAFSGADSMKQGLFEAASTGTLLLDEIGELDIKTQVKLLRVLDGVPYYRLGGTRKVTVDVRVVAATNVNLEEAIQAGRFRADLYHRLSPIQIRVPRYANAWQTSVPWLHSFSSSMTLAGVSTRKPSRYWRGIPGREMCANCATWSLARLCTVPAKRSGQANLPPEIAGKQIPAVVPDQVRNLLARRPGAEHDLQSSGADWRPSAKSCRHSRYLAADADSQAKAVSRRALRVRGVRARRF